MEENNNQRLTLHGMSDEEMLHFETTVPPRV